jgi:hypothetical protein
MGSLQRKACAAFFRRELYEGWIICVNRKIFSNSKKWTDQLQFNAEVAANPSPLLENRSNEFFENYSRIERNTELTSSLESFFHKMKAD